MGFHKNPLSCFNIEESAKRCWSTFKCCESKPNAQFCYDKAYSLVCKCKNWWNEKTNTTNKALLNETCCLMKRWLNFGTKQAETYIHTYYLHLFVGGYTHAWIVGQWASVEWLRQWVQNILAYYDIDWIKQCMRYKNVGIHQDVWWFLLVRSNGGLYDVCKDNLHAPCFSS